MTSRGNDATKPTCKASWEKNPNFLSYGVLWPPNVGLRSCRVVYGRASNLSIVLSDRTGTNEPSYWRSCMYCSMLRTSTNALLFCFELSVSGICCGSKKPLLYLGDMQPQKLNPKN